MNKILHNKVVDLIPSSTLKNKINSINHIFTDVELFVLINNLSHTYDQQLNLLNELFATILDNKLKEAIQQHIDMKANEFNFFKSESESCFYDIQAMETSYNGANYCCRLYKDINNFIKLYTKLLGKKYANLKYIVKKREFIDYKATKDLLKEELYCDSYGECEFDRTGKLLKVSIWQIEDTRCDQNNCDNCNRICFKNIEINYPSFLDNHELVLYPDRYDEQVYGIIFTDNMNHYVSQAYIHPLDATYLDRQEYDTGFNSHVHIDYTHIEKADFDKAPKLIKKNYLAYKKYLESEKNRLNY